MKILFVFAAALAVARLAVAANPAQAPLSVQAQPDPTYATAALTYQSPLAGFVPLQEPTVSPSSIWRETNRAVGSYDSMTATMAEMPAEQQKPTNPTEPDKAIAPAKSTITSPAIPQATKPPSKKHDMKSMPMDHAMPMHMEMK